MSNSKAMRALTLRLDDEIVAIDAEAVREILDLVPITFVPNASAFAQGVINVRGRVVPLADLRVALGMNRPDVTEDTRIIVVESEIDREPTIIGILADKVYDVTDIDSSSIEEVPKVGTRWRADYVTGVGKRNGQFVIIPNLQRIFETQTHSKPISKAA